MLVITLGVTGLSSVLLFLYFRNRIGQVEEKVDTVFQLIQNYESNRQPQFTVQEHQPHGYYVEEEMEEQQEYDQQQQQQQQQPGQQNTNPNNDLIAVSDKNSDSESESEDSESESEDSDSDSEESDNEEGKQLVLDNKEEEVSDVKVDDVEELDHLNLVKQEIESESLEKAKTIHIEENNDLDKLKVTELKDLCKEKGLSGYKSLRKNDLINLLSE